MRVSLEHWGDQVNIVLMMDDEAEADRHFQTLETQLRRGKIEFAVTGADGEPPALTGDS